MKMMKTIYYDGISNSYMHRAMRPVVCALWVLTTASCAYAAANITRMGMLMALTTIAALCMAPQVRAGGGSFYATVTNVTQLIADINYANTAGGTFTINLQPNTTFDLITINGVDAFNSDVMLPIIGGPNVVNLTIPGNGDTIQRDPTNALYEVRLIEVAKGSSLTLDHMTLQNGYCY